MRKMTVAVAQIASSDDFAENYAKAEAMIAEAAEKGARLIVFPENMNRMGAYSPAYREAIPGGECCRRMSAAAKKYGLWVNTGSIKEISNDPYKAYNTAMLYAPDGTMAAKYRKIHLCDMSARPGSRSQESDRILPGSEVVVADTELGKIGMAICYDMRFPELFRLMALQGAKIVCLPASFGMTTGCAHWEVMLRTMAIHNHCYVLASGQCGTTKGGLVRWGHSMIVDPWGTVIAEAGQEREALLTAEIDLDYTDELKDRLGSLTNRREDVYRLEGV